MAAQTQNQNQAENRTEVLVHSAHVAELSASDINIEELEVMTLDYEQYGDEIVETIEMLNTATTCIANPDLPGCDRAPSVLRLSMGRDLVTARLGENKRITYTRDGKVIIRTDNAVLLADTRFVLFKFRSDGLLEARTKGRKLTWHGTEEIFGVYEFRKMIRDAIVAIVDIARDVLQS